MKKIQMMQLLPPARARALAPGLGWFSIALGLIEVLAPRALAGALGMSGRERLLQFYGLRELGAGAGILLSKRPAPWLWARVAGDALDLATLLAHARPGNPRSAGLGTGIAAVAGVTLLDIASAQAWSREPQSLPAPIADYSDRSGWPQGIDAIRGAARHQQGAVH